MHRKFTLIDEHDFPAQRGRIAPYRDTSCIRADDHERVHRLDRFEQDIEAVLRQLDPFGKCTRVLRVSRCACEHYVGECGIVDIAPCQRLADDQTTWPRLQRHIVVSANRRHDTAAPLRVHLRKLIQELGIGWTGQRLDQHVEFTSAAGFEQHVTGGFVVVTREFYGIAGDDLVCARDDVVLRTTAG